MSYSAPLHFPLQHCTIYSEEKGVNNMHIWSNEEGMHVTDNRDSCSFNDIH